ncbi:MAG: class I SAM-dependent methyltransferase [Pseudomonadota bacterium]
MSADHFSAVAGQYAAFRPDYPPALFDWLASLVQQHELAWDCGAGSGQATVPLAERFAHVVATDISTAQLGGAPALPNVTYRIAPAEDGGLPDASCDLVTVAQAMHWFNLPQFYAEVQRVLKPQGAFVAWGYNRLLVQDAKIQTAVDRFYRETVGPYWPPERVIVESGYRDLPFPFARLTTPSFSLEKNWPLEHLTGYLRSWSAVARYQAANGHDPVALLAQELAALWPQGQSLAIEWPLFVHAGKMD